MRRTLASPSHLFGGWLLVSLFGCAAAAPGTTALGEGRTPPGVPAPAPADVGPDTPPAPLASAEAASPELGETGPAPPPPLAADLAPIDAEAPFPELARFYRKLAALELTRRRDGDPSPIVRVGWFGDSHTAADFLTDVVRRELWSRYLAGGPGFVRVGLADARHGQVRQLVTGRFRHEPYLPAQRERFGDGVFSFSGVRTVPTSGARATLSLRDASSAEYDWTLHASLGPGDALEVLARGETVRLREGATEPFARRLAKGDGVSIGLVSGRPRLFGASIESTGGGLVLDTVGINGARAATLLAWDEESFRRGLVERPLDVVVLAFGTNEAFDATPLSKYPDEYARVLERFRRANPEIECLVLGPPDAMTPRGASLPRVVELGRILREVAERARCGFLDLRGLMGGDGAFSAWRERPTPWARADRVHLTIAGYEELGRRVAARLLPTQGTP